MHHCGIQRHLVPKAVLVFVASLLLLVSSLPAQWHRENGYITPSICIFRTNAPFWESDDTFYGYMLRGLIYNSPPELRGSIDRKKNKVTLQLGFKDNSYWYVGSTPVYTNRGRLEELGEELIGIDALLENISGQLLLDAVSPSTIGAFDPDHLQFLVGPMSFGLELRFSPGDEKIKEKALGMVYEAELFAYHPLSDSFNIPIEYNGRDTSTTVVVGMELNYFDLACLKAFAIQEKARYAIEQEFGSIKNTPAIEKGPRRGLLPISWLPPKLVAGSPNKDALFATSISLGFSGIGIMSGKDGTWAH